MTCVLPPSASILQTHRIFPKVLKALACWPTWTGLRIEARIEDIIAENDKVAVRWTITGIYRGEPQPGYPKLGQKITFGSMSFYRFVNGKIEGDRGLDVVSPTNDPWS